MGINKYLFTFITRYSFFWNSMCCVGVSGGSDLKKI